MLSAALVTLRVIRIGGLAGYAGRVIGRSYEDRLIRLADGSEYAWAWRASTLGGLGVCESVARLRLLWPGSIHNPKSGRGS